MQKETVCIHWFRRDLRLFDNHALAKASESGLKIILLFVFDIEILNKLEDKDDFRITIIHNALSSLNEMLKVDSGALTIFHDTAAGAFIKLSERYNIQKVFANEDYEPYGIKRDNDIKKILKDKGIEFQLYNDHLIMHPNQVLKDNGQPYTVYTAYKNKWFSLFKPELVKEYTVSILKDKVLKIDDNCLPTIEEIGFSKNISKILSPPTLSSKILSQYEFSRDYPGMDGTTGIGPHLRFGLISVRKATEIALHSSKIWFQELVWREFFMQILYYFPYSADHSFKPAYDRIEWQNNPEYFERWCAGETGYPIVDAGMHQLKETGLMHNRVRMIVASFLCKHLLIDWRWGEAWFARHLSDFELSSNVGNWQWSAGSGCDAAPYFRIFNPYTQTEKFDKNKEYINRWCIDNSQYNKIQPIVDHNMARNKCLEVYSRALKA